MRSTGLISHNSCKLHVQSSNHVESPERLFSIESELIRRRLVGDLKFLEPTDYDLNNLFSVHPEDYVRKVEKICKSGGGLLDHGDTRACSMSYESAQMAAHATLLAAESVMKQQINNAFCAVRPPGHHALPSEAMGFCIFNNIAIVANYLREKFALNRILIVDIDVHHGNGTQDIFYENNEVFFFSSHQFPFYPGSGSISEIGKNAGEGYTMNIPLSEGTRGAKVISALEGPLYSAMQSYKPQFILVSSGFDGHELDPVGGMRIQRNEYRQINQTLLRMAQEFCDGRIISILEGGYNTEILGMLVADQLEDFLQY